MMNSGQSLESVQLSLAEFYFLAQRIAPLLATLASLIMYHGASVRTGGYGHLRLTFAGWGERLIKAFDAAVQAENECNQLEKETTINWVEPKKESWIN